MPGRGTVTFNIYSPDGDNAYRAADRMILARVPKGRITKRGAYEFFKGLGEGGIPLWTEDIAECRAVFGVILTIAVAVLSGYSERSFGHGSIEARRSEPISLHTKSILPDRWSLLSLEYSTRVAFLVYWERVVKIL